MVNIEAIGGLYLSGSVKNYGEKIKARFVGSGTLILGDVLVDEGSWIGHYCLLEGLNAKLTIGKSSVIASYSAIYTHNTMLRDVGLGEKIVAKVSVGRNVHIGHGALIVPKRNGELSIGDHVIVQALAVVSENIPSWHMFRRDGTCVPLRKMI